MQVNFILDDDESVVTPMKIAEALADIPHLSVNQLKELVAYLSVYIKYNSDVKNLGGR